MTVTVNGQTQQGCANVLEQLTQMGFDPKRVAVEKKRRDRAPRPI